MTLGTRVGAGHHGAHRGRGPRTRSARRTCGNGRRGVDAAPPAGPGQGPVLSGAPGRSRPCDTPTSVPRGPFWAPGRKETGSRCFKPPTSRLSPQPQARPPRAEPCRWRAGPPGRLPSVRGLSMWTDQPGLVGGRPAGAGRLGTVCGTTGNRRRDERVTSAGLLIGSRGQAAGSCHGNCS